MKNIVVINWDTKTFDDEVKTDLTNNAIERVNDLINNGYREGELIHNDIRGSWYIQEIYSGNDFVLEDGKYYWIKIRLQEKEIAKYTFDGSKAYFTTFDNVTYDYDSKELRLLEPVLDPK